MNQYSSGDKKRITSTVINLNPISEDIFKLDITRQGLSFFPGDYVSIYTDDGSTAREYSIASGISDPYLTFLVKHVEHGMVTEYLIRVRAGQTLYISEPTGNFRPGRQHGEGDFVFIASGTGIAPFLSYLKSYPQHPPLALFYGVRYHRDAEGFEIFRETCSSYLAISRETIPGYHHGRITDLLRHLPLNQSIHYYLCGLDAMITEMRRWLIKNRVPPVNIHHEIFFHSAR